MPYFYYIDDGAHPGQTNMDRDEALLEWSKKNNFDGILLRFYTFSPPCLSLGRFQKEDDINLEEAKDSGLDIIRRPTGGRAVIHENEFTYSVVFNWKKSIFSGNIRESYRKISIVLNKALNLLGFETKLATIKKSEYHLKNDCFISPSYFELMLENNKIMGSAQLRKRDYCLQHGSLILKKNKEIYNKLFGRCEEYCRLNISYDDFISSVLNSMEEGYNIRLEKMSFESLMETKYDKT